MTRTDARWIWGTLAADGSVGAGVALAQEWGRSDLLGGVCALLLVLALGLFYGPPLVAILPKHSRPMLVVAAPGREPTRKPWQTEIGFELAVIPVGRLWERRRMPVCAVLRLKNRGSECIEGLEVELSYHDPAQAGQIPTEQPVLARAVISRADGSDVGRFDVFEPGQERLVAIALADRSRREWMAPVGCATGDVRDYYLDDQPYALCSEVKDVDVVVTAAGQRCYSGTLRLDFASKVCARAWVKHRFESLPPLETGNAGNR